MRNPLRALRRTVLLASQASNELHQVPDRRLPRAVVGRGRSPLGFRQGVRRGSGWPESQSAEALGQDVEQEAAEQPFAREGQDLKTTQLRRALLLILSV